MTRWIPLLAYIFLAACEPERIVIAHKQRAAEAGPADATEDAESDPNDAGNAGDPELDAEAPGEEPEPTDGCSTADDCVDSDHFCARTRCEDARGTCERRPTVCSPTDQAPHCGCDGLSYFNDCVRQINGVTAATPGECRDNNTRFCGLLGPECPKHAYCARLKPGPDPSGLPCELNVVTESGRCWVLPGPRGEECAPQPFGAERYVRCGDTSGGSFGGGMQGSGGGTPGGSFGGGSGGGAGKCVSACEAIRSEQVHIRTLFCL